MLVAAICAGAILALAAGYAVHRWRFVPGLAAVGVAVIAIDISTRDLTAGGHDDRALVALAEGAILLAVLALFAIGIVIRRTARRRRNGRGQIPPKGGSSTA